MKTVTVRASASYCVYIGNGILSDALRLSGLTDCKKVALVCDENALKYHREKLLRAFGEMTADIFTVPSGESSKNIEIYTEILNFLSENGYTRNDGIAAFGGGVTGDIAGFAAATYMRGIKYCQIPTTLLSAVDSSIGGKTGIDSPFGKNLIGAFYQPAAVICDTSLLDTLAEEVFADGMAEVIKYGILGGNELFSKIESFRRGDGGIEDIIAECVKIKADHVSRDEFDRLGIRALLNLGHTPAHAIEKLSCYTVSHGSAVATGLCIMSKCAEKTGISVSGLGERIENAIISHGLPTECVFSAGELAAACKNDKKRNKDSVTLILPEKIGYCVMNDMPLSELEGFFGLAVR